MIEIVEVKTKKQLKQFILFPFKLYENNEYWVPPLIMDEYNTFDKKKNPALEYCDVKFWLAYKDGEIVGRVAGIINYAFIEKWKEKNARFGWIEFIDDIEVSKALLNTVENWALENNLESVHGPLGFCDEDKQGMLVEGFEELGSIITIYNHPYFMEHMKELGYTKDAGWIEVEIKIPKQRNMTVQKLAKKCLDKYDLRVVDLKSRKDSVPYIKKMFNLLNIAYKDLYGVVPLTEKQMEVYTKQYFSFVNIDFISFIVDKNDDLVAFGIILPSLSKALQKSKGKLLPLGWYRLLRAIKKNNIIDLYLVAVRPNYQKKGVATILIDQLLDAAIRNNIEYAIASPELETNKKVQSMWRFFDKRIHRRRTCFKKSLK